MSVVVPLLGIAALIAFNAVLVVAEFALVAAPRTRLMQRAEDGSSAARYVLTVLRDPGRDTLYIATTQVGITAANLALGMYGEHTLASWIEGPLHEMGRLAEPASHTIAFVVAVGLLTYVHIVLGEMVPKSVALQSPVAAMMVLATPMRVLERLLFPMTAMLTAVGAAVTRALGVPATGLHGRVISPSELEFIVDESFARGVLMHRDQLLVQNILDFSERSVGQVMTPRNRIVGLHVDASEADVMATVCEARLSRYPVYGENLDDVVGVLLIKDLARRRTNRDDSPWSLRDLVRAPIFVPESLGLEDTLTQLRTDRSSAAIVFDEYGGTAGLVTMEDIVEEIVGEIRDEFDAAEIAPLERMDANHVRARGDVILEELNQHYELALAHDEADTVAGLVMDLLGRVAVVGDVVEHDGVRFEVEAVDGRAIRTVIVRLPGEEAPTGKAPEPAATDYDKSSDGSSVTDAAAGLGGAHDESSDGSSARYDGR